MGKMNAGFAAFLAKKKGKKTGKGRKQSNPTMKASRGRKGYNFKKMEKKLGVVQS